MAGLDRTTAILSAAVLAACLPEPQALPELQHYSEGFQQLQQERWRKADILIVLDNSSSMAEEQARLNENLGPLIEVLESEDFRADYRIAITTTDAGHPACTSSTPERGAFMLTPCTSRLDEFVADGEGGPSDVRALACTDICDLGADELGILPTTTDEDPTPKPRPWLERSGEDDNLPEGVDMAEALRCFAPQGVAGCDFETPLESMYQALLRAKDPNDPAYGFLRKDARLLVLFITDEDDCSPGPDAGELFSAESTSAVCWNAGVSCTGDPSHYDDCEAVNVDLAGNEGVADADAVLRPISRYSELFDLIMADKLALDPTQRPIIAVIAGAAPDGDIHFGEVGDTDPEFQQTFGIGPGCTSIGPDPDRPIRATPPVRLRAFQSALEQYGMYSVCEFDWTPALEVLWRGWDWIRPACYRYCALDTDPSTLELEPDCIVEEELPDGSIRHIEECVRDEQGYVIDPETYDYVSPPDVHACHVKLTDATGSTPSPHDDMTAECSEHASNLEFQISRRPGHPAEGGTRVTATCSLTEHPDLVCPGLRD